MTEDKKTLILEHVEKSKKGNWDAYINNFPKFVEDLNLNIQEAQYIFCLLYTSPSPRDLSTSRMPSSA